MTVSVDLTNTGAMDADEVVQLYISRPDLAGAPIRALVGFERIHLARGETRTVEFTLQDRALSTVDGDGVRRIVPGEARLWIGGGQPGMRDDLPTTAGSAAAFRITGEATLAD